MELRDKFAVAALQGLLFDTDTQRTTQPAASLPYEVLALEAYRLADAMLVAREMVPTAETGESA